MDIREKGYRHWEGELQSSHFNWLPITLNGVKTVFKKKYAKLIFSLSASTFFVFLAAVYVSTKPELKILSELVRLLKSDAELFKTFYANGFLIFMLVILSIFSGADLISADLKFKAFPLYFARPLSRGDYLTGKFSIVLFYLLSFTLVPGILLLLFKMLFYRQPGGFAPAAPGHPGLPPDRLRFPRFPDPGPFHSQPQHQVHPDRHFPGLHVFQQPGPDPESHFQK